MSTGKRLAKRSILGTRVSVLGLDGLWSPGMIQAVKTQEEVGGGIGGGVAMPNRYSIRFDDPCGSVRRATEFLGADICGSGFKSVSEIQLAPGQQVYVTHNGREMKAKVVRHDFESQDVILQINEAETQLKKIDEIRLLESRKSARLVNSDTDFSKLADVNISPSSNGFNTSSSNSSRDQSRKAAARGSGAIAVPDRRTDYVQIAGSRKRRTSETVAAAAGAGSDCEETMTECSAAMLLMKLSCSPMAAAGGQHPQYALNMSTQDQRPPSVDSSSGASSFRSSTPSPPLSSSAATDEGIVKDMDRSGRVIYQCTYRGCGEQHITVRSIEAHVRKEHLLKEDPDKFLEEGEEEFYYTEVEDFSGMSAMVAAASQAKPLTPAQPFQFGSGQQGTTLFTFTRPRSYSSSSASSLGASQLASLSLVDHLDMARPAHEDPGRGAVLAAQRSILVTTTGQTRPLTTSLAVHTTSPQARNSSAISMPITIAPSAHGSPGKYILISPPHRTDGTGLTSPVAAFPSSAPSPAMASAIKSPTRRVREGKKCRKVYGLEQRDLWCTQCKWKKACARFGTSAVAVTSAVTSRPADVLSTSSPAGSLLMAAANSATHRIIGTNAARAIKF